MKSKPESPKRKESLMRGILNVIAEAIDESNDTVRLPWIYRCGNPMAAAKEAEMTEARRRRRIREAIRKLKEQNFIEIREVGNAMEIAMTEKGEAAGLLDRVRNGRPRRDGGTLLVSFDIPEQERSKRTVFTRKLRYAGLEKMHASLWATDKDVRGPLEKYIKLLGTGKWVSLYEAKLISKY
jgi:hypothetical protein